MDMSGDEARIMGEEGLIEEADHLQVHDFMSLVDNPVLWQTPMVVSIGVFDGIHLGHQSILRTCTELASRHTAEGWQCMVISFNKNPKMTHGPQKMLLPLMGRRQEHAMFNSLGFQHHVIIDFSDEISKLSGEEFLNLVCGFCSVKALVVGEDFRCGAPDKSAGPVQLQEYLQRMAPGGKVIVPPFYRTQDGQVASSSRIRTLLLDGNVSGIQEVLGRDYILDLAPYPYTIAEDKLVYRVRSFVQLVPSTGTYDGILYLRDGNTVIVQVAVDAEILKITGLSQVTGVQEKDAGRVSPLIPVSLGFVRSISL